MYPHPECKDNEIYFGNFEKLAFRCMVKWSSRRMGKVAYDIFGKVSEEIDEEFFPVFLDRKEVESCGYKIVELENKKEDDKK